MNREELAYRLNVIGQDVASGSDAPVRGYWWCPVCDPDAKGDRLAVLVRMIGQDGPMLVSACPDCGAITELERNYHEQHNKRIAVQQGV